MVLGDRDAAGVLGPRMAPLSGLLHTEANVIYNIGRICGGAAVLLGEPEKARGYYRQALEVCTRARFRPELALTRLQLAELLLEEAGSPQHSAISPPPDPSEGQGKLTADQLMAEGLEHLDFAITGFREMKMQPSLERALKHKGLLHA